ncbi:YfbR-like 5'-deoxynucleotidase [Euryhalocaulis caribicus]|uniref:YfbR-like 5'-deoxynucleotidase n=1 Tax=Euryhalocaulis caribicus TaxID=1161401 RepID=UPI0003A014D6|nr:HD family hydrolase [Euryhalocaulis caribicus]
MAPNSRKKEPPRAWQRMLSGRRLDLLDPSPFDIEIEDVAHGLARVARWNGQTIGDHAFSVAQHSVIVEGIVAKLDPKTTPAGRLAALLHDAPEYVIGDMISPFKTALGFDYKDFEARLEAAVHLRFGLPAKPPRELKTLIKKADTVCAYFEATQLAGFSDAEARRYFGVPPRGMKLTLRPQTTMEAQQSFLDRFEELRARRDRSEAAIGRRARSF